MASTSLAASTELTALMDTSAYARLLAYMNILASSWQLKPTLSTAGVAFLLRLLLRQPRVMTGGGGEVGFEGVVREGEVF